MKNQLHKQVERFLSQKEKYFLLLNEATEEME